MSKLGPDEREGYVRLDVAEGYEAWASTYDRIPNPLIAAEEKVTLGLLGDVAGKRILDLGCGTGRYSALLAKRGAQVIGIDPSARMLEQAKRKVTPPCHFELHQSTLEEMSFLDEHFDLVLSALTLGHIPRLDSILTECARILKPDGCMIISDIHPFWAESGHDYAEFRDETRQEYRIPEYPHLIEEYWNLFRQLGMRLEELHEPRVDEALLADFPGMKEHEGVPFVLVLKARRIPRPNGD